MRSLLRTIDTPVSAADWRALGSRAVAALESTAAAEAELPTRRARAVGGLTAIGGARARQAVTALAVKEGAPFAVRAAALRGAGRLLGPKALEGQLRPVLEGAGRSAVRATAAEVLAARAPAATCAAVRAQAAREGVRGRSYFQQALTRCGQAEP